MRFIVIAVCLVAAIGTVKCQTTSDEALSKVFRQYLSQLKRQEEVDEITTKFEQFCPGKGSKFQEALESVRQCADEKEVETETLCSAFRKNFVPCMKPLKELAESCLPEESKDLPSLVLESTHATVDYICKADGEHIFELSNPCGIKTSYKSMRCERRLRSTLQKYQRKTPNKSGVCDFFTTMKPCIQSHLQVACGNEITRESFMGVVNALISPCNDVTPVHRTFVNTADFPAVPDNQVEILE